MDRLLDRLEELRKLPVNPNWIRSLKRTKKNIETFLNKHWEGSPEKNASRHEINNDLMEEEQDRQAVMMIESAIRKAERKEWNEINDLIDNASALLQDYREEEP